ncbi:MAG: FAD-binding oxidoreductase, partial [Pirellulales bacterium]|nr:FAD-binding oxidoreductase [Pirellulales bacterium]
MSQNAHVIVIGAGIIGASIAWRLVEAGARVTLIDANEPGGIASPCSFGWTNATWGNARPYFDLRTRSMREWDALAARLDGLPYERCGTLYIHFDRVDLDSFYEQHTSWGYALDWITREDIARLEPHLRNPPERALFAPGEGIAEADETAQFFTRLCREAGADIETGRPVESLLTD